MIWQTELWFHTTEAATLRIYLSMSPTELSETYFHFKSSHCKMFISLWMSHKADICTVGQLPRKSPLVIPGANPAWQTCRTQGFILALYLVHSPLGPWSPFSPFSPVAPRSPLGPRSPLAPTSPWIP